MSDFYKLNKNNIQVPDKELRKELLDLRDDFIQLFSNHISVNDGMVNPISDLHKLIASELSKKYNIEYHMENTDIFSDYKRPISDSDKVFIIFDRDYSVKYFDHTKYLECIRKCDELKYLPIVSSPKFELWLLMHHKNPDFGNPSFYPSYGKHISNELCSCGDWDAEEGSSNEKFISSERFEKWYQNGIGIAIERSKDTKLFVTGAYNLMNRPGTDLGILVGEIINRSIIQPPSNRGNTAEQSILQIYFIQLFIERNA